MSHGQSELLVGFRLEVDSILVTIEQTFFVSCLTVVILDIARALDYIP